MAGSPDALKRAQSTGERLQNESGRLPGPVGRAEHHRKKRPRGVLSFGYFSLGLARAAAFDKRLHPLGTETFETLTPSEQPYHPRLRFALAEDQKGAVLIELQNNLGRLLRVREARRSR